MAIFPLQDVLGLDASHRMNTPGTMGPQNWSWRFEWHWLNDEHRRVLGLICAASGRAPFGLV
jgi:4-alpha-glucanotransferase